MKQATLLARLIFGAWMLANGLNHFFFSLWPIPTGHEPLAIQLMDAFVHSGLFSVAMAIELVAGALILSGFLVPLALCVLMPVSTCALFWSLILDHQPLGAVVALLAFALNGLLMVAYLEYYSGTRQRHALTIGETAAGTHFDSLYTNASGRSSRAEFLPALVTLLAVFVFYAWLVTGRTAVFCMLVLLYPAVVLHARRLHDMGHSPWLLAIPAVLLLAAFSIWLKYVSLGTRLDATVPLAALAVAAGFALWGSIGRTRTGG